MHSGEWSAYMKSALYYFDFELNLIMIGLKHGKTELHLENWLNKVIQLDIFIRYLINTKDGGLIELLVCFSQWD